VDAHEKVVLLKTLGRDAVSSFFAKFPPCLIGMEATKGAGYDRSVRDIIRQVRRPNIAAVALANKNFRIASVLLSR
jgi:hypothetical protein